MTEDKIKCPFCAEEILKEAKKCKHCGSWLDQRYDPQESIKNNIDNSEYQKRNKNALGCLIILMLPIILFLFSSKPNKENVKSNISHSENSTEVENKEIAKKIERQNNILKRTKSLKPEQLAKEVYSEVIPILKEGIEMEVLRQQDRVSCIPIMRRLIPITDDLRFKAEQLPTKYLALQVISVNLGLCVRCNQSAQEYCDMVSEDLNALDNNYLMK